MSKGKLMFMHSKQNQWLGDAVGIWLAPFRGLKAVLKEDKQPLRVFLDYARDVLRLLGVWPDKYALAQRFYKLHTSAVVLMLSIFWLTMVAGLYEAGGDIVALGESIMFLLGVTGILLKTFLFIFHCNKLNDIVTTLNQLHVKHLRSSNARMRSLCRMFFIGQTSCYAFFIILASFLWLILSVQPLLTEQALPIPALFPFGLQDPERYPWGSKFIYGFQVFATFYCLQCLVCYDSMAVHTFSQIALHLRLICEDLRRLGNDCGVAYNLWEDLREIVQTHQQLIDLIDRVNDAYYANYVVQMASSTFMICLSGFEALIANEQPMVAFKFMFFLCAAFLQLFAWCLLGNLVYFDSLEVAEAAYETHEWFNQSPSLQRNLQFLIMRAQKPLVFRAKPFYPFTLEAFRQILSTSYKTFTLLCCTIDQKE